MKSLSEIRLLDINFIDLLKSVIVALVDTLKYEYALYSLIYKKKKYSSLIFFENDKWAKVQVFSLSLIFKLWSKPHYRSPSLQQDLRDNLRNVAVPGTGMPLSLFCLNWFPVLLLVVVLNPVICFIGAINKAWIEAKSTNQLVIKIFEYYSKHLLNPDDWFSLWQLNCRLVSYHSWLTKTDGYLQENKWTFLTLGKSLSVPVSPYFSHMESLVCKNVNVEGGMGIHFYENAAFGGEWILQEKMKNAPWLEKILPENAPLSTMRVITISNWSIKLPQQLERAGDSSASLDSEDSVSKYIRALSAVLRLGRADACTDHSSIFFNVDLATGIIGLGTSNSHWYQLGLDKILTTPWLNDVTYTAHPDPPKPPVTGQVIPDMKEALKIVTEAHYKMMKDVPIVGWDVAFTDKGIFLLEVNLSCNFFKGRFNMPGYIDFMDSYFTALSREEL